MRIWKFQSTLPHGERQELFLLRSVTSCFNPRSHTGSDLSLYFIRTLSQRFNPRSHTGSDLVPFYDAATVCQFQSTLPHGERPTACHALRLWRSFNPRSHTGSDRYIPRGLACPLFQSTLPHGERLSANDDSTVISKFQSTLPHGERLQFG